MNNLLINPPKLNMFTNNIVVKISNLEIKKAYQESQKHSNSISKRNAYNNYLCFQAFLNHLKSQFPNCQLFKNKDNFSNLFNKKNISENNTYKLINLVIPDDQFLSTIWELINGTLLEIDQTKLVIIPFENEDLGAFSIPQEWVDIPNWNADYYLFSEIDEDENEDIIIRFSCFATHSLVKKKGKYNEEERSYLLSLENVCDDFSFLWMTKGLNFNKSAKNFPELSIEKAENLLTKLSNPYISHPRLAIDFQDWAALLTENKWRETLYNRRLKINNLRNWLKIKEEEIIDLVTKGWQNTEVFFNYLELNSVQPELVRDLNFFNEIISLIQPHQPKLIRNQAVGILGAIKNTNFCMDIVNILTNLIDTDHDEDIRYQAGLSLGKLIPDHPKASVSNSRLIDLAFKIEGCKIVLVVTIIPKNDNKLGIWIQVKTVEKKDKLPPRLTLSILSEYDEIKMEVVARNDHDNKGIDQVIQKRFTLPFFTHFKTKVSLDDISFIEEFVT
jgi:hypothetical protein